MKADLNTEPVRLSGYTALVVGLALQGIILWSSGTPLAGIAGALASVAAMSIGGLEFARKRVWSQESHLTRINQVAAVSDQNEQVSSEAGHADNQTLILLLVVVVVVVVVVKLL